jgi:OOP family OmpA-OmpF porin
MACRIDRDAQAPKDSMMMKLAITRTALAASLLAGGAAAAHAEGFYAGASIGAPNWTSDVNGVGGDNRGVSGKAFGGYEFSPHLALEAGAVGLGHRHDDLLGKASGAGGYVDAVGRYEFAPQWSLLGRAGIAYARFSSPGGDDSSAGGKVGAGVQYDYNSRVALRAEYEYYHFPSTFDSRVNVGQFTAGIKVAF